MILKIFQRPEDSIVGFYGAIVAQARQPAFYRFYSVPDTVNGRFEMVVLHAALMVSRLEADSALRKLGQAVFDRFCSDMDANLREMGVGDIGVPRKMKAIGEAFFGRKRAYAAALAEPGLDGLVVTLQRNVYGGVAADAQGWLAEYVREANRMLAATEANALLAGRAAFPDPMAFVPAAAGAT